MGYVYAVLGAGMQGTAAAYDLARFGDADEIRMGDTEDRRASAAAERVNRLVGRPVAKSFRADAKDDAGLVSFFRGAHAALSAVPYDLNPGVHRAAVAAGCGCADLGGHTGIALGILRDLKEPARSAGVTLVPDCGLAPGLGTVLATAAIRRLGGRAQAVRIRCGGLPVKPRPPLGYKLVFNIRGLTNEYFGPAYVLRDGAREVVPSFDDPEPIRFGPPIGRAETSTTSGGTGTLPWTFEGKVRNLDYRTVRYPGHWEKMRTLLDLGLLDPDPVRVGDALVVPRELFHVVAAPRLSFPDDPDLVCLRVEAEGDGGEALKFEMIEFADPETGFTAMERTTGYPAALVVEDIARGRTPPGAVAIEEAVDPEDHIRRLARRGIRIKGGKARRKTCSE